MPSAVAPVAASSADQAEQYLIFELAGQDYGIEILRVQEIRGWERPTRLPHAPPYVEGVINLRGTVVPVIDLRRRFGLGASEHGRTTVVIVARLEAAHGELIAGLVVDGVCQVCTILPQDRRAPPEVGAAIDASFVRGLALAEERMLVLLDVTRLLSGSLAEAVPPPQAA